LPVQKLYKAQAQLGIPTPSEGTARWDQKQLGAGYNIKTVNSSDSLGLRATFFESADR